MGMLPPAFIAGAFLYASKGLKLQTKIIFGIILRILSFIVAIALAGSNINIVYDVFIVIIITTIIFIFFSISPEIRNSPIFKFFINNLGSTFIYFSIGMLVSTLIVTIYYYEFAIFLNEFATSKTGAFLPFIVAIGFFIIIAAILYAEHKIDYTIANNIVQQKYQGGALNLFKTMQKDFNFMKIVLVAEDELTFDNFEVCIRQILDKYHKQSYNVIIIPCTIKAKLNYNNLFSSKNWHKMPIVIVVEDSLQPQPIDEKVIKYARNHTNIQ